MKYIIKQNPPVEFEEWKKNDQPTKWDELQSYMPIDRREEGIIYYSKRELRQVLLKEQSNTCCFCEGKIIDDNSTSIAHLEPREGDTQTERIFDYYNLMASCSGGTKDNVKPKTLHCDAAQKNRTLPISPLNSKCETEITFTIEGKIYGLSDDAKNTISILNLDIHKLNNLRSNAIAGFLFKDEEMTEYISIKDSEKIISYLENEPSQQYRTSIIRALEQLINIKSQ